MLKAVTAQVRKAGLWCVVGVAMLASPLPGHARKAPEAENTLPVIALAELPREGRTIYRLIHQGGPFPYEKDGSVFGNRERLLPQHTRGYYREYTVKTPGAQDRGARRIVCGGEPRLPDACYYTADHYASFRAIVAP